MALRDTITRFLFLTFLAFALAEPIPDVDYDVIIVGGGPAGLSALSAMGRVRRTALMYDSGKYRNGDTRHMHDVIGNDGAVPEDFRSLAREQISKYETTEVKNAKVLKVENKSDHFSVEDDQEGAFTSRKLILGTGLLDVLPDTPGVAEAFSNGIFWCPWCDGWEHRDQPFGVLGQLSKAFSSVLEMWTLNQDIIAFVNGTHTPEEEEKLSKDNPTWREQLEEYNVKLDNRTITSIDRIQDGGEVNDPENHLEFDIFQINFDEGESVIRNAFITNFPSVQRSTIPTELGLNMTDGGKIDVGQGDMRTSMKGVFAVGDANDDGSTNVPHAMFSAKRAVVYAHVELAKEDSKASIGKRGTELTRRQLEKEAERLIGDNLDPLWKRSRGV